MAWKRLKGAVRLNGSGMIEMIVAMVLIMVVFGIAMVIFTKITTYSPDFRRTKAALMLEERMSAKEKGIAIPDGETGAGQISIEENAKQFGDFKQLISVKLTAYGDNHQKLAEIQKVIFKK